MEQPLHISHRLFLFNLAQNEINFHLYVNWELHSKRYFRNRILSELILIVKQSVEQRLLSQQLGLLQIWEYRLEDGSRTQRRNYSYYFSAQGATQLFVSFPAVNDDLQLLGQYILEEFLVL